MGLGETTQQVEFAGCGALGVCEQAATLSHVSDLLPSWSSFLVFKFFQLQFTSSVTVYLFQVYGVAARQSIISFTKWACCFQCPVAPVVTASCFSTMDYSPCAVLYAPGLFCTSRPYFSIFSPFHPAPITATPLWHPSAWSLYL